MQAAIGRDRGALDLEVQARACEYSHLFGFDQLRGQLLEHMPALDESHYSRNMGTAAAVDMSTEPAAAQVLIGLISFLFASCILHGRSGLWCEESCRTLLVCTWGKSMVAASEFLAWVVAEKSVVFRAVMRSLFSACCTAAVIEWAVISAAVLLLTCRIRRTTCCSMKMVFAALSSLVVTVACNCISVLAGTSIRHVDHFHLPAGECKRHCSSKSANQCRRRGRLAHAE